MSYRVFSTGFSDDFTSASPQHGMRHAGDFSDAELLELLCRLSSTTIEEDDFAPRLRIQAGDRDSLVSLSAGELHFAAQSSEEGLGDAVTPEEVCKRLNAVDTTAAPCTPHMKAVKSPSRAGLLLGCMLGVTLILQLILVLSGYYSFTDPLEYTPVTETVRLERLQTDYTGVFWSDNEPERTVLTLSRDGKAGIYVASEWEDLDDFMQIQVEPYEFGIIEGEVFVVMDGIDPVATTAAGQLLLDGETLTRASIPADLIAALTKGGRHE
ncbi:MAG: hypothetical protein HN341_18845 [Verrucomicrobia bacterium]|jgi:hypothetical protein|nr:hypothetical protein [Verrucomicrobiota bacterium]